MDDRYTVLVEKVKQLLSDDSTEALTSLVDSLHPADVVDILELLDDSARSAFFHAIPADKAADIVQELDPEDQTEIIRMMGAARSSEILREMDSDDAADLIGELPESKAETLLELMNSEGDEVRELLQYDEDSSGGIMATEYVTVNMDWTVEKTLAELRHAAPEAETVYYIYVVDADERLVGVLSLRDLVIADLKRKISSIMSRNVLSVPVEADQEEAAQLFKKYRYLALPVVDRDNRLAGIITADDILDVVEEEATEDIQKIAGTMPLDRPYFATSVKELWRSRVVWLMVLFLAESVTGKILQNFSTAMQSVIELTFFIPLLIDCGGNVGSQAASVVIRGPRCATYDCETSGRVYARAYAGPRSRPVDVGHSLPAAWKVGGNPIIGVIVCTSVLVIVTVATIVGSMLPIAATALHLDPAVMSSPLITTIVDGTGLMIYFSIARALLKI